MLHISNFSFRVLGVGVLLLIALAVFGCGKSEQGPVKEKKLTVVTTLFPLYDFAREIGRDKADVSLLLPPGVEPHNFEPRPTDIVRIEKADVFVYTGPFMEPWVDRLLKGINRSKLVVVDASAGIPLLELGEGAHEEEEHVHGTPGGHGAKVDPHIWLDFSNAGRIVDHITVGFIGKRPADRDFFNANAEAYKGKLRDLDERYRQTLSQCRVRTIVQAGHLTFGYLAKRYGLRYVSVYPGFTPDQEPTPRRLIEVSDKVKREHLQYIFYEELITPRVAQAISKETGAGFLLLHGAHNITQEEMERGATFLSLMEKNLENLKTGLQCR